VKTETRSTHSQPASLRVTWQNDGGVLVEVLPQSGPMLCLDLAPGEWEALLKRDGALFVVAQFVDSPV
jgi:hypothetical protein